MFDILVAIFASNPVGLHYAFQTNLAGESAFHLATARLLAAETSPRTRRACSRIWEEFFYASSPAVREPRPRATSIVRELAGPYFRPPMGPRLRAVAAVTGWKLVRRFQLLISMSRP